MLAPAPVGALRGAGQDDRPEDLRLLVGDEAGDLLAAVAAAVGATLTAWRPRQVAHRPGRSTVVQYRTTVRWPHGRTTSETFVAATGDRARWDGAAVFAAGSTEVAVWRWPRDPRLPALADAVDPVAAGRLLDDAGLGGGTVQLRTRAYRPGRRAVVEAVGGRGRLFLKVVPPDRVQALHELHRSLAAHVPVPRSLGWSEAGRLVLAARPGRTLREALRSGLRPLPPPDAVSALLDRLPDELAERPARPDPVSAAGRHAAVIAATVPGTRNRLDDLLADLAEQRGDPGPVTAVHGDLYEAQILVDGDRITGLLDVDTAGAGRRIDDLANLCAHLSVLALSGRRSGAVERYGRAVLAHAAAVHDRAELCRRIAAAVVGLATGPFRVQQPGWDTATVRRLDLAGEWLGPAPPW